MKLREYQETAADFLYARDRAMILAPVGAGKTAITLTAMQGLGKFLVVAPKRVAVSVWPTETKKWAPKLSVAVCVGTPAQRLKALSEDADITVTNYDNLQWLSANMRPFDGIVFDELTRLKNPSGARFKALLKVINPIKIRWGLTGSFTSNGLEDVFGQCKIIDQTLLGRSKGAFQQQYFVLINKEFGQWEPRVGSLKLVMDRIKHATFVLEPGEYADKLPPLHTVDVDCEMDMGDYEWMKQEMVLRYGDERAIAANAAVVTAKLQQLACIAHDTPVLTDIGWLPIQQVTALHRVWDGEDWVEHEGCIFKGVQQTVDCFSVRMTYNHKVLTAEGWQTAKEILDGDARKRFDRFKVRLPDGFAPPREKYAWLRDVAMSMQMRNASSAAKPIPTRQNSGWSQKLWVLPQQHQAWDDQQPPVSYLGQYAKSVLNASRQRLRHVRGRWDKRLSILGAVVRSVLGGYAKWILGHVDARPHRWSERVLQTELPMGVYERAAEQSQRQCVARHPERPHDSFASRNRVWPSSGDSAREAFPLQVGIEPRVDYARTYDLLNCGPRNRFVVKGTDERPLIVHNCGFVYAESGAAVRTSPHKFDALDNLLQENQHANTIVVYNFQAELEELQRRYPKARTIEGSIDDWNEGRIELLLIHPKSAGHGLNLQHGGSKIVFFSLPWSLELYEQTIGRLHRSGQRHDVWCYRMITKDTVDEKIARALQDKRSVSDIAMEALK